MTVDSLPVDAEPFGLTSSKYHQNSSFLHPGSKYHDVKISVNHWQLRDLVCKNSLVQDQVFYPTSEDINALDLETGHTQRHGSFEFAPRCIKELDGIFVAGGVQNSGGPMGTSRGQFGIMVSETGVTQNLGVGSLINNCVSIDKQSNAKYVSLICNNDQYLYWADITPSGAVTTDMSANLGIPLNHASLSPDQKTIVACGDNSDFFVLHPEELHTGARQQICTTFDNGFSTSFHPNGLVFATTFQEGVALVYDIRNISQPIHTVWSTRRNAQNGAFRCCKFAGGTDDLLFISEHVGRVHMVDTRDFANHQVIMLPQLLRGSSPLSQQGKDVYNESLIRPFGEVVADFNHYTRQTDDFGPSRSRWGARHSILNQEQRVNRLITVRLPPRAQQQDPGRYRTLAQSQSQTAPDQREPFSHITDRNPNAFFELCDTELSGLEWLETRRGSSLAIGCSKGVIKWDIACWGRKCFPSFGVC
ncbi:unnamed protein product [Kuraishia capsulata CBS 1993]|uniref:DUF2415 domain-containing protein n=1 Tax=Kuraishia capsulata CBS 1993 TaxID=1382522 RepID=W6MUD0_9ASCO|nr:uncharacterized protein KUCA_T00005129001 [Kuraishia capsulata CBS 1993]CDK29142.1 unnamed protein product [Kuraishia capsulata CBS 1993]